MKLAAVFIFYIFSLDVSHAQQADTLDLNFGKEDYDLMRSGFSEDTLLLKALNLTGSEGDKERTQFMRLLKTPYEQRSTTGFTEQEIGVMIEAYYLREGIKNSFMELDKSLEGIKEINSDSLLYEIKEAIKEK